MPVDVSFSVDIGSIISPLAIAVVAILVNQARKGVTMHFDKRHDEVEAKVDERHKETTAHLERIEAQTTATNGRVTKLEGRQEEHERDAKADHDLLLKTVGQVETLLGRKGDSA